MRFAFLTSTIDAVQRLEQKKKYLLSPDLMQMQHYPRSISDRPLLRVPDYSAQRAMVSERDLHLIGTFSRIWRRENLRKGTFPDVSARLRFPF